LVDQRILVEAPAEAVWTYISDPAAMPKWHRGCKQVSILSTKTAGVGTRRRCIGADGRAVVEEITAWFENIGYEFIVVDGPYREFRGRFRLQAVPEGTIVNWTVDYKLKGPLAGLRNTLSFHRQYEDMMAESLRQLRRLVEASGIRLDPVKQARFAMQSGPSAEARAGQSPPASATPPISPSASQLASIESTKPSGAKVPASSMRPVAVGDDDVPEIVPDDFDVPTIVRSPDAPHPVPASLSKPSMPPPVVEGPLHDTKPRPPNKERDLAAQEDDELDKVSSMASMSAPTVPASLVAPPYEAPLAQETETVPPPAPPKPPDTLPERVPTKFPVKPPAAIGTSASFGDDPTSPRESEALKPSEEVLLPSTPPPTTKTDTGEISIWDVFGMERPSERAQAELEKVIASLQPQESEASLSPSENGPRPSSAARKRPHPRPMRKARPPVRPIHKAGPRQKTRAPARKPQH
jgi:uncharacterized membrane protein